MVGLGLLDPLLPADATTITKNKNKSFKNILDEKKISEFLMIEETT